MAGGDNTPQFSATTTTRRTKIREKKRSSLVLNTQEEITKEGVFMNTQTSDHSSDKVSQQDNNIMIIGDGKPKMEDDKQPVS